MRGDPGGKKMVFLARESALVVRALEQVLAVVQHTRPVRKGDTSHGLKGGDMMIKVSEHTGDGDAVIETRDRRKVEPEKA